MLSPTKGLNGKVIHIQVMGQTDDGTDGYKLPNKDPVLSQISIQNILKQNTPESSGQYSVGDYPSQRVTEIIR